MSLFVVHRQAGPGWAEGKSTFQQPGINDHAAFMNGLAEEGLVVAAGPLADTANDRIRVLMIAEATSDVQIAQRLASDPWERGDRITTTLIEPWELLSGALSQPPDNET